MPATLPRRPRALPLLPALALLAAALAPALADAHPRGGWGGHGGGRATVWVGPGYPLWWGGWRRDPVYSVLPAAAVAMTLGAVTYWVWEGRYYRELPERGGYVLVPAPVPTPVPVATAGAADAGTAGGGAERVFVYPRNGQSADKQAGDEYDCHRWAVEQSGTDPVAASTDGRTPDAAALRNYRRAQSACLDARGYTVR